MQNSTRPVERRRKPDIVVKLVTITSAIGWMLIVVCLLLAGFAKPEQTNMFYEMFNIPVRGYWNYSVLYIVFVILIFLFVISLLGILFNAMRQRRKTDKINKSLIFHAAMALVGILILLINSMI